MPTIVVWEIFLKCLPIEIKLQITLILHTIKLQGNKKFLSVFVNTIYADTFQEKKNITLNAGYCKIGFC